MEYLEKIKSMSPRRKKENLVLILILLVVLLISFNYIFKVDNNSKKEIINGEEKKEQKEQTSTLEEKISNVLAQINGVSDVSVILNYIDSGENEIVYDTREEYQENGTIASMEKSVAYSEENGDKNAIISIKSNPKVEGVIVVAKGVENSELKQKISNALANLLGIASYKIQVFEK